MNHLTTILKRLPLIAASGLLPLQAAMAQDGGQDLDPLQSSYPQVYDTLDGAPPDWPEPVKDADTYYFFQADRLELGFSDDQDTQIWDAQGWIGRDYNKLWLKTEGEGVQGEDPEAAEVQALYSRVISPFWDLQAGVRYDARPNPERAHAVLGLQGLAPQWFETDAAAFLSEEGDATFRVELEYELLLTQRLILQPRFEVNASAQAIPELGLGSGFNSTELGLRLRYEIRREVAPYVGVSWSKTYADTADMARAEGEATSTLSFVAGIRLWY